MKLMETEKQKKFMQWIVPLGENVDITHMTPEKLQNLTEKGFTFAVHKDGERFMATVGKVAVSGPLDKLP